MNPRASEPSILPHRCSLIVETVESLRKGIHTGVWKDFLPGERSLSDQLQVGRTTLRKAMRELEEEGLLEVSQGKRRRIVLKKKGASRILSQQVVGVISPVPLTAMNASNLLVLDVLRTTLERAGFAMEIHYERACYSSHPSRALRKLVNQHSAIVWMLMYSKEAPERWFARQDVPCLVMGSSRPEIPITSIDTDHRAVCYHAGGVLLRKGHKEIALVLPKNVYGGDADSEQGLSEMINQSKGARLQVLRHNESAEHICSLVDKALNQKNPPTAFVVARAVHVLTVHTHLLHCGKRIPQDVSIISRDDEPFLRSVRPVISRYMLGSERYARRLASASRQLAEGGIIQARAIRLMPDFLAGETL